MWVQQAMDARWFASRARPWLERYPVESNVLASWLEVELAGRPRAGSRWWLVSDDTGALAGVAFQARNLPLQLAPMTPDAAAALALHYAHHGLDPLGVSGVAVPAQEFAVTWQAQTRARVRLTTVMRIHALQRVLYPRTAGIPRQARPEDADLCETWLTAYTSEVHPEEYRDTLRPMVERRLRAGELWLWEHHGQPVALAGVTPAVAGVARVAPVYTPPVNRRHGYGAGAAAAAAAAALADGAHTCMLFADADDPAVQALYRRLGFRPVADAARYAFEPVLLAHPIALDPWMTTPPLGVSPVPPMPLEPARPADDGEPAEPVPAADLLAAVEDGPVGPEPVPFPHLPPAAMPPPPPPADEEPDAAEPDEPAEPAGVAGNGALRSLPQQPARKSGG